MIKCYRLARRSTNCLSRDGEVARPCSVEYGVARVPGPRMQSLIPFRAGIMCYTRRRCLGWYALYDKPCMAAALQHGVAHASGLASRWDKRPLVAGLQPQQGPPAGEKMHQPVGSGSSPMCLPRLIMSTSKNAPRWVESPQEPVDTHLRHLRSMGASSVEATCECLQPHQCSEVAFVEAG